MQTGLTENERWLNSEFTQKHVNRTPSSCQFIHSSCPPSRLRLPFLRKSKLVARKQGHCAEKASAQSFRIADFGFWIFWVFFFNPHSAIRIPQFGGGPIGRPARRPYTAITLSLGKEPLARPTQKMNRAS